MPETSLSYRIEFNLQDSRYCRKKTPPSGYVEKKKPGFGRRFLIARRRDENTPKGGPKAPLKVLGKIFYSWNHPWVLISVISSSAFSKASSAREFE